MGVGQQKVLNIRNLQRVAIGDPSVIDAQAIGNSQLILTAKKHGRTTLIIWLSGGRRENYTVRVSKLNQGVIKDIGTLLKDIEGLQIRVADQYIVLDGEVYRAIDYLRIQKVMKIFPLVKSLVIISPNAKKGLTEQLNTMFKENGLRDIKASVIGDMIFLEGFVSDEREKVKALSIAKSLGLKRSETYGIDQKKTQKKTSKGIAGGAGSGAGSISTISEGSIGQEFVDLISIGLKKMILLELQFVEIEKNSQLKVGLEWKNVDGSPNVFSNVAGTYESSQLQMTQEGAYKAFPTGQSYYTLYPKNTNHFAFGGTLLMNADLNLLSDNGYARTLAKPRLLCASGEKAKFHAGGEVPFVVRTDDTITVTFKEYGIKLEMEPIADNDNNILSKVKAEVSQLDWANAILGYPSLKKRSVETSVTVHTGDTIVLSGLFKFEQQKAVSKMAGLGHIPILGELFKSRNFQDGKSELLIFVHPIIVRPDTPVIKNMINDIHRRYKKAKDEVSFSILD